MRVSSTAWSSLTFIIFHNILYYAFCSSFSLLLNLDPRSPTVGEVLVLLPYNSSLMGCWLTRRWQSSWQNLAAVNPVNLLLSIVDWFLLPPTSMINHEKSNYFWITALYLPLEKSHSPVLSFECISLEISTFSTELSCYRISNWVPCNLDLVVIVAFKSLWPEDG